MNIRKEWRDFINNGFGDFDDKAYTEAEKISNKIRNIKTEIQKILKSQE